MLFWLMPGQGNNWRFEGIVPEHLVDIFSQLQPRTETAFPSTENILTDSRTHVGIVPLEECDKSINWPSV